MYACLPACEPHMCDAVEDRSPRTGPCCREVLRLKPGSSSGAASAFNCRSLQPQYIPSYFKLVNISTAWLTSEQTHFSLKELPWIYYSPLLASLIHVKNKPRLFIFFDNFMQVYNISWSFLPFPFLLHLPLLLNPFLPFFSLTWLLPAPKPQHFYDPLNSGLFA